MDIVRELLGVGDDVTFAILAERFDVSERTIRNDIASINSFLEGSGLGLINYGPGGSIVLPDDFVELRDRLPEGGLSAYRLSRDERRLLASVLVANATSYITLSEVASRLGTSRVTIIHDLDAIRDLLSAGYLELVSRSGRGLIVNGEEAEKRAYLLLASVSAERLPESLDVTIFGELSADDTVAIRKILNERCQAHQLRMTDDEFRRIRNYLCIMVHRVRVGCRLEEDSPRPESLADSFATDVLALVAQYCRIEVNDAERNYLQGLLASANLLGHEVFQTVDVQTQVVCRQFIDRVSKGIGVNLSSDYDLFEFLSRHMGSLFSERPPQPPATTEVSAVVGRHPELATAVRQNRGLLETFGSRSLSEVELDYICLHLCAALEQRRSVEGQIRVIVACSGGVGMSQLLAETLRGKFDFEIVDVIPSHEASLLVATDADLMVSTAPLRGCPIKGVVVSSSLGGADLERIRREIDRLRGSRRHVIATDADLGEARTLIHALEAVVTRGTPEAAGYLMPRIRAEVRQHFLHRGVAADHRQDLALQPYLYQLLPASHIQLDVACQDWRDAIEKSAAPLLDLGYISERYVGAMIRNAEENGPYFVLSQGFAMPHEGTDRGALKLGMNLIRLVEPVCFGADELDPIDFVCTLSATDAKTHLRAFFNLVNLLREPTFKRALRDAVKPTEAAAAIERHEWRLQG